MKSVIILSLFMVSTFSLAQGPKRSIAQEVQVLVQDSVYKIMPAGGAEKVLFRKHSGIYYLKADSKHYSTIKKALEESAKSGEKIKVKANADSMEIEEIILETK